MQQIGETIDDGNGTVAGQLFDVGMIEGPDHDAIEVARQHPRGVANRLAAAELDVARREEESVAAELEGPDLEGHPGAGRRLREDHPQGLAEQGFFPVAALLHPGGQVEEGNELGFAEVWDCEEVADGTRSHRVGIVATHFGQGKRQGR